MSRVAPTDAAADELWSALRMMPAEERRAILRTLIRAGNVVQQIARAKRPASTEEPY